jgi:hypothetical protein
VAAENIVNREGQENSSIFKPFDRIVFKNSLPERLKILQEQLAQLDEDEQYHNRVRNPNPHIDRG